MTIFTPEFEEKLDELQNIRITDRAIEDLYDLLIDKNIIQSSEVYPELKQKFDRKKQLRNELDEMAHPGGEVSE